MIDQMVADVQTRAAELEHAWDARAVDWPDLTMSSVVVEVGGYVGRWALQIAERYHPRLFVFEPQPWAAAVCRAVLGERANVYNVGLGTEDATLPMGAWETDGCSFTKAGDHTGQMREIRGMLDQCLIAERIDLMLMNIEGYEYTLIPHMLQAGILPRRIMVQAHGDLGPLIHQIEAAGYKPLWSYGPVLTAWGRA